MGTVFKRLPTINPHREARQTDPSVAIARGCCPIDGESVPQGTIAVAPAVLAEHLGDVKGYYGKLIAPYGCLHSSPTVTLIAFSNLIVSSLDIDKTKI